MIWIILSIFAALTWAIVNFIDKYIVEKISENRGIGSLVIFSGLAGIPVTLITFIFSCQEIFSTPSQIILWVILAGILYLTFVLGYLYALSLGDVSLIVPQLLFTPVITISLSYLFLGEILTIYQLFGSSLIILGALILSANLKDITVITKIKVILYIVCASIALSINNIIFKYAVAEAEIDFWVTIFWEHIGFIIFAIFCFTFIKPYRVDFLRIINTKGKRIIRANIFSEVLTIVGNLSLHYSTLLIPVAVAQVTADGIQPFFILLFSLVLTKFFPHIISEDNGKVSILNKIAAFGIMVLGLYFVNSGEM